MHKWSFLLIACLAAIQPIASFTNRRLFDGRQQYSTSGQVGNANLLADNFNRKSPEPYRLSSRDNNRNNQQFHRYESRINHLNRNINHRHIEYQEQTLGRVNHIRNNVFDGTRNLRERSITSNRRFESRENHRSVDGRARVTEDRLARYTGQVLRDHNYARSENQERSSYDRDFVFRDQTRANHEISDIRRADIRNQMTTNYATERYGASERSFERDLFRDQTRANREIGGHRRTDIRKQLRTTTEGNVNSESSRWSYERGVLFRDQTRGNRENRENRRADTRSELRSTTEKNIDTERIRISERCSKRDLASRDQARANRDLRDNRSTVIRNQMRRSTSDRNDIYERRQRFADSSRARLQSQRRSREILHMREQYELKQIAQRDSRENRFNRPIRENRSERLIQYFQNRGRSDIDNNRNIRNDIRQDRVTARLEARSKPFDFSRMSRVDSKIYRTENSMVESRMDIRMTPEKSEHRETGTFLRWHYAMYSLQAIYIYSIVCQLLNKKTKGKKTFSNFMEMSFTKQIKAE